MQYSNLFTELSNDARLWIYGLNAPLNPDTETQVSNQLSAFMANWQSHGRKVIGQFAILHNQFIVISAEIPKAEISGCGIDASVHALQELGATHGFELLSGLHLFYKDVNGQVVSLPRSEFRKRVKASEINADTLVYDTSLTDLSEFRLGKFALPAGQSWHATVFKIRTPQL